MLELTPLRGIGRLLFGMTRAEVSAIFGSPSSRTSDDPGRETWFYAPLDLALYFDAEDGWRLESIQASHPDTHLLGVRVFRQPHLAVLTQLAAHGLSGPEVRSDPSTEEVEYHFRPHRLHLWREGTHFTSCALGVPFGTNDAPAWPHNPGNA